MTDDARSDFQELISDENMHLAWKRLTHSMRREVKDWRGLQAYAPQIDTHIQIIQQALLSGYEPSISYPFYKTKQDRSLRTFSFLTMDDRFVYQALCNVLIANSYDELMKLAADGRIYANIPTPLEDRSPYVFERVFGNRFSTSHGQYEKFRGQVLRSRREFLVQQETPWLVRTDVRSYFPSLDHSRLRDLLTCRNWLSDEGTRDVLMDCLKKWEVKQDNGTQQGLGIPIGYESSDHIGNVFLIPLDEALEGFKVHRYVDDIYIYVENFERAKQAIHIVDTILKDLSLQRNTLKTEFLNLQNLSEKELQERLTESLSQLATEKSTEKSKAERQRDLLSLLHSEFGEGFEKLELRGKIASISKVAFVIYRLRWADETVRHIAYHVLDHHPNYAYHAMTYLYHAYSRDPEFKLKLVSIFEAEYEAQDTKANALKFLNLVESGNTSSNYIKNVLDTISKDNWFLAYFVMRDIVQHNNSLLHFECLSKTITSENPFLSSFAAYLSFERKDAIARYQVVDGLLKNNSDHVKKFGLYLANRYQTEVNPSAVQCYLEGLMDEEKLEEKDYFHNTMESLFNISLSREFPIQGYFGNITTINQVLRDLYMHREQGIDIFVIGAMKLLTVLGSVDILS